MDGHAGICGAGSPWNSGTVSDGIRKASKTASEKSCGDSRTEFHQRMKWIKPELFWTKNSRMKSLKKKSRQRKKYIQRLFPHAEELEMEFEDEFEDDDEDEEDEEVMKEDLIVTKEIVTEDEVGIRIWRRF